MIEEKFATVSDTLSLVDCSGRVVRLLNACREPAQEVNIDLSDVGFAESSFVVILAGAIRYMSQLGAKGKLIWPADPKVKQYLVNIGFAKKLVHGGDDMRRRPMSDHVPLEEFPGLDEGIVQNVCGCFARHLHGVPDLYNRLENTLAELMENVRLHSESPVGGLLSAQFLPNKRTIRFAICDFGVSIPGHLSRLPKYSVGMPDDDLVAKAFEAGVSGAQSEIRSGSGLPFVRDFTMGIGGQVRVYSRLAALTIGVHGVSSVPVPNPFPGTLFTIDWPSTS
jgi:hypothetical protein